MDPGFSEMPSPVNGFNFDDERYFPINDQSQNNGSGNTQYEYLDLGILDTPFLPSSPSPDTFPLSSTVSYESQSPDDQDSDPVLKFLNQILLEENMEEKPSMFHDPLALQAAEKSLYDVIGQEYPPPPCHPVNYGDQPSDSLDSITGFRSDFTSSSNSIEPLWTVDPSEYNSSLEFLPDSLLQASSQSSFGTLSSSNDNGNTQTDPFGNTSLLHNFFTNSESISQFKRGMEEASKFLPTTNPLIIDLDKYELPKKSEDIAPPTVFRSEDIDDSPNGLKGRKHHLSDDGDSEDVERSNKQSATYVEDTDLSEMFDRFLLCNEARGEQGNCSGDLVKVLPNGGGSRARINKKEHKRDTVDLRTLLISCAQSVASDDRRTAYEQLKHISMHASLTGDGYQRLAYVFAAGLQARLGGTGTELHASLTHRNITAAEKLKAYHVYLSACPFKKMSIFFANKIIGSLASDATVLHIIDFGILYGFQWPVLIQMLSERAGGPLKLRITGIELPQPGFRPAERMEETGVRLAKYCERFGVPFEYQAIAAEKWDSIKIEDFKIESSEMLAVNCLFRFGRLLDETVVGDSSPRDVVLRLITRMKPDVFVHAVTSGSYSAPFFVTRFREALFHYSALFDMLDATLPRENPHRMDFEQKFYGPEVINVIACEGTERFERPETYKQWQLRCLRHGFKPLPLDPELMKKLRHKVKSGYHKDFLFDEDDNWMIQGWKGRIICASSCWVPS